MRKIHCGNMTDTGQRFRERAPGEQAPAEMQHFQYERTLINGSVTYRFGSDTMDLSRLSDNEVRARLAEELRKPTPSISVFQTGSTGQEIQISNEFVRNRVADRLDSQDQSWVERTIGPIEVTAMPTEAVPAEREAARWVTYRSEAQTDGTYFSMRVNEAALTEEQARGLANLQYRSPDEWQRFANSLGSKAANKELHVGTS